MVANDVTTKSNYGFFARFPLATSTCVRTCLRAFLRVCLVYYQNDPYEIKHLGVTTKIMIAGVLCQGILENPKYGKNIEKLPILATWKLRFDSQCSQKIFKKPIRYFQSRVDCVIIICHQISYVTASSGSKISLKIEFFLKGLKNHDFSGLPQDQTLTQQCSLPYMVRISFIFNSWQSSIAI